MLQPHNTEAWAVGERGRVSTLVAPVGRSGRGNSAGAPSSRPEQKGGPSKRPSPTCTRATKLRAVKQVALLIVWGFLAACSGGYASTVNWEVGSADLTGEAYNRSGEGCSHFTVAVKFKDHNKAVVSQDEFDVGEVRSHDQKPWDHRMSFLGIPRKIKDSVTDVEVSARCADQH